MKKILYTFLFVTLFIVGALFVTFNSSFVIEKVAKRFAPEYHISYDKVEGNLLSGLTIHQLSFKNKILLQRVAFRWNPLRLLDKTVWISRIDLEGAKVDNIEEALHFFEEKRKQSAQLSSDEPPQTQNNMALALEFHLAQFNLDINPFRREGIVFEETKFHLEDASYQKSQLEVKRLEVRLKNTLLSLNLEAKLADEQLTIEHLALNKVDTLQIESLLAKQEENNTTKTAKDDENETEGTLPFQRVCLDDFESSILPRSYHEVSLKKLLFTLNSLCYDLQSKLVEEGTFELNTTTNMTQLNLGGVVRDNTVDANVSLHPTSHMVAYYKLPIRKEALGKITIDIHATKQEVLADIYASAKHVLEAKKGEFNIDIQRFVTHVAYGIEEQNLSAISDILIETPYAKEVLSHSKVLIDSNKTLSFSGDIQCKAWEGLDSNITTLLQGFHLTYEGTKSSLKSQLDAKGLEASFVSNDMKEGIFHLETPSALSLGSFVSLPSELKEAKLTLRLDAPIDLKHPLPLDAKAVIVSNLLKSEAQIHYDKALSFTLHNTMPSHSLLKKLDEKIVWKGLMPMDVKGRTSPTEMNIALKTPELKSSVKYMLDKKQLKGSLDFASLHVDVEGDPKEKLTIQSHLPTLSSVLSSIPKLYHVEDLPAMKGDLAMDVTLTKLKNASIRMHSNSLTYNAGKKDAQHLDDVTLKSTIEEKKVRLESYALTYKKTKFFSTKPSNVTLEGSLVKVAPFWLNDALKVTGTYNLKTRQGDILTQANALPISHEIIDLKTNLNLKTKLEGEATTIKGKVTLLGGKIKYDLNQKTFASDSDILIVQEMRKNKPSAFMDNLTTSILIQTKQPLLYKQGDVNIKAKVELGVEKSIHSEMLFLGSVTLLDGGSYTFEGKRFVLKKSSIYFTGNPNKPILDIKAQLKTVKYLITIAVSGTPEAPYIHFSSVPSLTKEQILSVILFDSEVAAENNSGEDMMKMMGGAMAKSALSNVGVKLDHLVLGEGNSIEVGKKISNKLTIIYINDEVSSVRLQYDHSRHIEADLTVSPESTSGDIFYKRSF